MDTTSSDNLSTTPSAFYVFACRVYRVLQISVAIASLIAVIWGWQMLHSPTEFPIRVVKVQANCVHVDKHSIQQLVLPSVTRGFFNLNTHKLSQQLQQIPWIAHADVTRIWPDIVIIRLSEQKPVANWQGRALLSDQGALFFPPPETYPKDLPILSGSDDKVKSLWQDYQQFSVTLAPIGLSIHQLNSNTRESLELVLTNGTKILLGRTDPLPRLQRFVKVYPKIVGAANAHAAQIDLRYDNGLAVQWSADTVTTPPAIPTTQH